MFIKHVIALKLVPIGESADSYLVLGVKSASMSFFVLAGKIAAFIAGAAMLIVVARLMGPADYGVYTVAMAVAALIAAFGSLNANGYFNFMIPKLLTEKRQHEIGVMVVDTFILFLLLAIVLMAIGWALTASVLQHAFSSQAYTTSIYVALLAILWIAAYSPMAAVLVGLGMSREVALTNSTWAILQAGVSITLVALGFGPVGAIIGYIAGLILATMLPLYYINKRVGLELLWHGMASRLGSMLRFTIPITGAGILNTLLNNFSVVLLGILLIPASVIGQYGLASRAGLVIDVASGSISVVLIPLFATAKQRSNRPERLSGLYQGSIFYGVLFTLPVIVYASVMARDLIVTVFTSAYSLTILYMPLISVGILFSFVSSYAYSMLVSLGRVMDTFKYAAIAYGMSLISMLLLGPLLGVLGVLVAYFYVGNIALTALYMRSVHWFGIRLEGRPIILVVVSALIFGLSMAPLLFFNNVRPLYLLVVAMAEGLVVYPAALVKTGALSKDEIGVLHKVSDETPVVGALLRALLRYCERLM